MLDRQARLYPTSVTSAFGRLFYGAENRVYFSQVFIDDPGVIGKCYQNNDPTSTEISDLLDTDGGEITLQNAGKVLDLVPFSTGVLALCERGVWFLGTPETLFSATSYSVDKITDAGVVGTGAACQGQDVVYYASESGVYVVVINDFNNVQAANITEFSINSQIQPILVDGVMLRYDSRLKQVHVRAPLGVSEEPGDQIDTLEFIYNERVQGWYKNSYGYKAPFGMVYVPGEEGMVYGTENSGGVTQYEMRLSKHLSEDFRDYGAAPEAFIKAHPETLGKGSHNKRITSMKVQFRKTESEILSYDTNLQKYLFDAPSACTFKAAWDFDKSNAGKREVIIDEIYEPFQRKKFPDTLPATFDTGEDIISTRFSVRGYGRAVQFTFTAKPDNDLQILGYTVEYSMRGRQ